MTNVTTNWLTISLDPPLAATWRERRVVQSHVAREFYARRDDCRLIVTVYKKGHVTGRVERKVKHAGGQTWNAEARSWPGSPLSTTIVFAMAWCERTAPTISREARS